jgi:transcriptional regulator with GAF, ATPase, and Fis domain
VKQDTSHQVGANWALARALRLNLMFWRQLMISTTTQSRNFFDVVEDYERKLIGEALAECNGNQARAARLLGLKPTTLNSQIQRLGIDVRLYRQTPPSVSYETFQKFVLWKAGHV